MTAHYSKSYLSYLNKLVDQHNTAYHRSINKKRINDDHSALNEKIETKAHKLLSLKLMRDSELLSIRIF